MRGGRGRSEAAWNDGRGCRQTGLQKGESEDQQTPPLAPGSRQTGTPGQAELPGRQPAGTGRGVRGGRRVQPPRPAPGAGSRKGSSAGARGGGPPPLWPGECPPGPLAHRGQLKIQRKTPDKGRPAGDPWAGEGVSML